MKSAVLQRLAGVAPVFNPRYVDFARHYGFAIAPCNVARGNEKGRVESGVGYVKKNEQQARRGTRPKGTRRLRLQSTAQRATATMPSLLSFFCSAV